ncbi:unnamed protein product [Protopolystoma xenopodis]|uniref:Uncharacterized protein n=1 Tax=Protopolystoma xenopodis TaxID=117903 RepID=A0A448XQB3_9PLAT|nr:unnamed protein product [Protopolystoma xenopodis]
MHVTHYVLSPCIFSSGASDVELDKDCCPMIQALLDKYDHQHHRLTKQSRTKPTPTTNTNATVPMGANHPGRKQSLAAGGHRLPVNQSNSNVITSPTASGTVHTDVSDEQHDTSLVGEDELEEGEIRDDPTASEHQAQKVKLQLHRQQPNGRSSPCPRVRVAPNVSTSDSLEPDHDLTAGLLPLPKRLATSRSTASSLLLEESSLKSASGPCSDRSSVNLSPIR